MKKERFQILRGAIRFVCGQGPNRDRRLAKPNQSQLLQTRFPFRHIVTTLQTYSHILDEMEQKESRQVDLAMAELDRTK